MWTMADDTTKPMGWDDLPEHVRRKIDEVPVGEGGVPVGDSHTETAEQARERLARRAEVMRGHWLQRLPDDYTDAALVDFDEELRGKALRWLAEPTGLNFVAAGKVGTGKTHLGYAMGNEASGRGLWCEGWTVHDYMDSRMPDSPVPGWQAEKYVRGCDLLLLDDLGAGRVTPFAVDQITALVDHRVSHRRKTIVTTNATEPDLRAVWGDRLMDRLRKGLVAHRFEGASRRKPAW